MSRLSLTLATLLSATTTAAVMREPVINPVLTMVAEDSDGVSTILFDNMHHTLLETLQRKSDQYVISGKPSIDAAQLLLAALQLSPTQAAMETQPPNSSASPDTIITKSQMLLHEHPAQSVESEMVRDDASHAHYALLTTESTSVTAGTAVQSSATDGVAAVHWSATAGRREAAVHSSGN